MIYPRRKKIGIVIAAAAAVIAAIFVLVNIGLADAQPPAPVMSKTLTPNGDGSYQLTMSVKGKASKTIKAKDANVVVIMDRSASMGGKENKLQVEQAAVGKIANLMGKYNTNGETPIHVSLIDYGGNVNKSSFKTDSSTQVWTDNKTAFLKAVSNVQIEPNPIYAGGSNWEAALQAGREAANEMQRTDENGDPVDTPTYILFISDGDPSYRQSAGYKQTLYFLRNFNPRTRGYNDDSFWVLPNNPPYGTGDENNDPRDYNYSYAVAQAQNITDDGYNLFAINIYNDNPAAKMPALANASGAHYYNASNTETLQNTIDSIAGYFEYSVGYSDVKLTDSLTDMTAADIRSGVTGTKVDYKIKRTTDTEAHTWYNAPELTFEDGKAVWDLAGRELEDGAEYSVSFRVWPNQEAYDLLADLKNGTKDYDNLTESQRSQLVRLQDSSGNIIEGAYGLKTNPDGGATAGYQQIIREHVEELPDGVVPGQIYQETGADQINYSVVYSENSVGSYTKTMTATGEAALQNPEPITLTATQVPVVKVWQDAGASSRPEEVKLQLFRDSETSSFRTVTLNKANDWNVPVYIAPGLIDKNGKVLNEGHDYYASEVDLDADYEFSSAKQHPMIVNGTLQKSAADTGTAEIKGENNLKGSLIVTKTVNKADSDLKPNPDTKFTFLFHLKKSAAENADAWTGTAKIVNADGTYTEVPVTDGTKLQITSSQTIRIDRMPRDTYYKITETDIPDGYALDELHGPYSDKIDSDSATAWGTTESGTTANIVYVDKYTAAPVNVKLPVHKHVSGTDVPDITGAYTFKLEAVGSAPVPEVTTKTNPDADGGRILFGTDADKFTFTKIGTYYYHVTESNTPGKTIPGMTNDATPERNIAVKISDDGKGHLKASFVFEKEDADGCEGFTNDYRSKSAKVSIPVTKVLTLPDGVSGPDIKGKYKFTLAADSATLDDGGTLAADHMPMPAAGGESVLTNDARGGNMMFGEIDFNKPGRYTYRITESSNTADGKDLPGVVNVSEKTQKVVVTVTAAETEIDGKNVRILSASVPSTTFINRYSAESAAVSVPVKKALESTTGYKPNIQGRYTFVLATTNPNTPMPDGYETASDGTRYVKVKNPDEDGGTAAFPEIVYKKEGSFDYAVREIGDIKGITNDGNATRRVTVVVKDDKKGHLYVDSSSSGVEDPTTFTNTYSVEPTTGSITLKKTLQADSGLTPPSIKNAYTFRVTALTDGAPMLEGETTRIDEEGHKYITVANPDDDGGSITVNNLVFTKEGRYRYKIEESGHVAGIKNDARPVRYIQFVVEDKEHEGRLSVKVQTTDANGGSEADLDDNTVEYVNTYSVKSVAAPFSVKKVLSVPSGFTAPDIKGRYSFKLSAGGDAPMPEGSETAQGVTSKTVTNPDSDGGTASFGSIAFTRPGTYQYAITEHGDNSLNNVIRNDQANPRMATATVTDKSDGTMYVVITTTYKDVLGDDVTMTLYDSRDPSSAAPLTFTNTYKTPDPVKVRIPVTKKISKPAGSHPESIANDFTFTLAKNSEDAPMPTEQTSVTNPDSNGGTAEFGAISFTRPGTYRYRITEADTDPANPPGGFTEDSVNPKTVTVIVTDQQDGTLSAKLYGADTVWNTNGTVKTEKESTTFTNKYDTSAVSVNIPVTKKIDSAAGTSHADATGLFEFRLTAGSNDAGVTTPMPAGNGNVTLNPDKDGGTAYFGSITYTQAGTYHYTIQETGTPPGGYTNDTTARDVTVTVSDNGSGRLVADVTGADGSSGSSASSTTITNQYASKGTFSLTAVKKLSVPQGMTGPDIKNKFSFTLKAADTGTPMPAGSETASNGTVSKTVKGPNAEGYVPFGTMDFTKEGEYSYTITESGGSLPGVENDKTEKKITLVARDDGSGTMNVTVKDGSDKAVFTNKYSAEGTADIPVTKKLSGVPSGASVNIKGKYRFTITADEGTPMPETTSYATPDENGGTITFKNIKYTEPGTYQYKITESNEGDPVPGVTSDKTKTRIVRVKVSDTTEGTLAAKVIGGDSILDADGNVLIGKESTTFTNVYKADPALVSIPVHKNIRNPRNVILPKLAGAFKFTLTAEDGAPLPEKNVLTNPSDDGGDVTFGDIKFENAGTYTYTVSETSTDKDRTSAVIFDDKPTRTVTVVVTDDGSGQLKSKVYEGTAVDGAEISTASPLTFNNTFSPAVVPVRAHKTLLGRNMMPGEKFTFRIEPGDADTRQALKDDQIALTDGTKPADHLDTTISNLTDGHKTVFSFGSAIFRQPGEYFFKVTELVPDDAGKKPHVVYDESEQYLRITVSKNPDGTLSAATAPVAKDAEGNWVSDPDDTGFVNKYVTSATSAKPWIKKVARSSPDSSGVNVPFSAGDFTFTAFYKKGELTNQPVSSVKNPDDAADGTDRFEFNHIKFYTANAPSGEYTLQELVDKGAAEKSVDPDTGVTTYTIDYIMKETAEPDPYTTNDQGFSFQMIVKDDGKGNLTVTQDPDHDFEFDNFMKSTSIRVTLDGRKTLTGRELKSGEVTFKLVPLDNSSPMPEGTVTDASGNKYKTATNVVGGEVHFGNIVFTQDDMITGVSPEGFKDFRYKVTEAPTTAGSMPKVDFQDPQYFTIRVEKKLSPAGSATPFTLDYKFVNAKGNEINPAFYFENTYTPDQAEVSIKAYKNMETSNSDGLTWKAFSGQFSFVLEAANNDAGVETPMPAEGVQTDADGDRYVTVPLADTSADGTPLTESLSAAFDSIKFTKAGIYNYTITETGSAEGVVNDRDTERRIAVHVSDDPDTGKLSAQVYNEDGVAEDDSGHGRTVFTNKYSTEPTSASITATKKLSLPEGMKGPSDITGKYTFTLRPGSNTAAGSIDTPMPADAQSDAEGAYAAVTNPDIDGGTASFGSIQYEKPGVYRYTISESGRVDGVENDSSKNISVTVTDNGKGKLIAKVNGTDTGQDDEGNTVQKETTTFTNKYSAQASAKEVTVTKILKSATPNLTPLNIKDKYKFTIRAADDSPADTPLPERTKISNTSDKADENGQGTYSFGSVNFTRPGTYKYEITESSNTPDGKNVPGIINDAASTKEVKAVVTDNGDGTMDVRILGADTVYNSDGTVSTDKDTTTFTNMMQPVVLSAQTSISGKQTLIGRDMRDGEKFTYTLEPDDEATSKAIEDKIVELNGGNVSSLTATVVDAKDKSPVTFVFDRAVFKQPGTYKFSIYQKATGFESKGMTFDEHSNSRDKGCKVTVVVNEEDDGSLSYNVEGNNPSFKNKYHSQGSYRLTAQKSLEGRPAADENDTSKNGESGTAEGEGEISGTAPENRFDFVIEYAQGDLQGQTAASGSVNMKLGDDPKQAVLAMDYSNDGVYYIDQETGEKKEAINLKDLVAKKSAATYDGTGQDGKPAKFYSIQYIVREKRPDDGSANDAIEYATNSYSIIVIIEDGGNGDFTRIYTSGADSLSDVQFANYYKSNTAHVAFSGVKELTGGASLKGDDFTFTLTGKNGAPMPEGSTGGSKTVKNDAGGSVDFGEIDYDVNDLGGAASKTFTYTVEESGSMAGVTNDASSTKTVKVTVRDDGNGVLTVTTDPTNAPLFTFTNEYHSTPGTGAVSDDIKVTKELTGRRLQAGEFSFSLKDSAGNEVAEAKNNADGSIVFPKLTFDQAGNYSYTIEEKDDAEKWVTYDRTKYQVTATVTEKYDGQPMTVQWTTGTDKNITFENSYHDLTKQGIPVKIVWKKDQNHLDKRPDSVNVTLYASRKSAAAAAAHTAAVGQRYMLTAAAKGQPFRTADVKAAESWQYTFEDLLIYGDGNVKIDYSVDETTPNHYTSAVTGDAEQGFMITNTWKSDKSNLDRTGADKNGTKKGTGSDPNHPGGTYYPGDGGTAQTGDDTPAAALIILMASALAVMLLLRSRRRSGS
jgi:pilin isopeptide linkage protein